MPVLEASDLSGYFDNLLSMYVVADTFESGESLISLIQWHWQVFDEDTLDEDTQANLLEDIANSDWDDDDGEDPLNAHALYQPLGGEFHTTHRDRWEQYCSDVRDNPAEALPFAEFLAEDFAQLSVILPIGTTFFRARRGFIAVEYGERRPYQGAEIGAPPTERAHAGRASVEGQRVLYCADQEATAVAEVRPARGFYVSVARVTLNREVRILDLANGMGEINPFVTDTLKWDVEIQSLLEAFAEEMSRPLERDDDPTHYLPCQRLADYIRDARYHGIRYPSALHPEGSNVIFFDPAVVDISASELVMIAETSLQYAEVRPDPVVQRIASVNVGPNAGSGEN
ncbi:MAG TPA: RES family NAD+ phosphorylase [Candidatus Angelobacter sp.]